MSDYRRYFVPGGTYFFTLVMQGRATVFLDARARKILGDVLRECQEKHPFTVVAMVLLPEHLHCIWTLPPGDDDYPVRWNVSKGKFTYKWLRSGGTERPCNASRRRERRRGVWQRRYWEHTIKDETDLENHFDYIHYNPVKHGLVTRPRDWPWSSFQRYVELGHYPIDWGYTDPKIPPLPGNAGEPE